jgi:hypothetical protein
LRDLTQRIVNEPGIKNHWSRELLDLRSQEKIFFSVKEYEKAEACRVRAEQMEAQERHVNEG